MPTTPSVTIVVPCYNEEHRLPVSAFSAYLATTPFRFLFVDDGSGDRTIEVLNRLAASWPDQARVLRMERNGGKAEAVRAGVLKAIDDGERGYVGFWDADLATPLGAIDDFIALLETRADIAMVFGSRVKLLGRHIERQALRHYLGRVFATVASLVLRMPIYDTQCGAKMFRVTPLTRGLFAEPFVSRWVFDVEIIARFAGAVGSPARASEQIYEFPLLEWRDIKGSKIKSGDFLKAALEIARIHLRYGKSLDRR